AHKTGVRARQSISDPWEGSEPPRASASKARLRANDYDLGAVRVHADEVAADSARAVHAAAYTVGPHIVFGGGRYAPGTPAGRRRKTSRPRRRGGRLLAAAREVREGEPAARAARAAAVRPRATPARAAPGLRRSTTAASTRTRTATSPRGSRSPRIRRARRPG